MMTFSEFGRRPGANASNGTDHGTSSAHLVIGENVKGGFFAEAPRLDALDSRGNTTVSVDFRSYYGSLLTGWLNGDAAAILGGSYPDLGLFKAKPGGSVTGPITTGPWVPFATPSDLVRQQYLDFYGRVGDSGGVTYWTSKLTSGSWSIVQVIDSFLHSNEFGRSVAPVARLALVGLGGLPAFDDLMAWAAAGEGGRCPRHGRRHDLRPHRVHQPVRVDDRRRVRPGHLQRRAGQGADGLREDGADRPSSRPRRSPGRRWSPTWSTGPRRSRSTGRRSRS